MNYLTQKQKKQIQLQIKRKSWNNENKWNKKSRRNRNENIIAEGKIKFERMKNSLDEFEMNESEENVNAGIKILINNKVK